MKVEFVLKLAFFLSLAVFFVVGMTACEPTLGCSACQFDPNEVVSVQVDVQQGRPCPGSILEGTNTCIVTATADNDGCITILNCRSWDYFASKAPKIIRHVKK